MQHTFAEGDKGAREIREDQRRDKVRDMVIDDQKIGCGPVYRSG